MVILVFLAKIMLIQMAGIVFREAGSLKNSRERQKKQGSVLKKQKKNFLKKHIITGKGFLMKKRGNPDTDLLLQKQKKHIKRLPFPKKLSINLGWRAGILYMEK